MVKLLLLHMVPTVLKSDPLGSFLLPIVARLQLCAAANLNKCILAHLSGTDCCCCGNISHWGTWPHRGKTKVTSGWGWRFESAPFANTNRSGRPHGLQGTESHLAAGPFWSLLLGDRVGIVTVGGAAHRAERTRKRVALHGGRFLS